MNLLPAETCRDLIQFHKSHRHLTGVGDGSDYTGIRFMHIHTPWVRKAVAEVIVNLTGEIRKISDQIVYPEMSAMNEWPIGGVQRPHLDTYSNQEVAHGTTPDKPSREWTCILYLNHNYSGGCTYIPDGQVYEPLTGAGLLFQGIYIPHGVQKVRRHPRHTLSFWFTTDITRCMPINPVEDLSLDEDSWRLQNTQ